MITIELNGTSHEAEEGRSLAELLDSIGSNGKSVATVVNDQIVRAPERPLHIIREGDRVEVLVFAGGG